MICQKCRKYFLDKEIEVSHDIPKYLGGTDADGRHNLCHQCHQDYEWDVIKLCWMNYVKNLSEDEKKRLRFVSSFVKHSFFKEDKDENKS